MMVVRTVNSKGGHSMMNLVVRRMMLVWLKRKREVGPLSSLALPRRGAILAARHPPLARPETSVQSYSEPELLEIWGHLVTSTTLLPMGLMSIRNISMLF
jgi:hypothetical protein